MFIVDIIIIIIIIKLSLLINKLVFLSILLFSVSRYLPIGALDGATKAQDRRSHLTEFQEGRTGFALVSEKTNLVKSSHDGTPRKKTTVELFVSASCHF